MFKVVLYGFLLNKTVDLLFYLAISEFHKIPNNKIFILEANWTKIEKF
jgi:hypothetical protein